MNGIGVSEAYARPRAFSVRGLGLASPELLHPFLAAE